MFEPGTFTNGLVVYADNEDIEGFKLLDQTGYFWEMKTPTGGEESKMELVYGPIVGFRVLTRQQSYLGEVDVYERVPIYMSAIYNTCACSISTFRGDTAPYAMEARAVQDEAQA